LWTILGSLLVGTCLIAGERITRRTPPANEAAPACKPADSPATTTIASTNEQGTVIIQKDEEDKLGIVPPP